MQKRLTIIKPVSMFQIDFNVFIEMLKKVRVCKVSFMMPLPLLSITIIECNDMMARSICSQMGVPAGQHITQSYTQLLIIIHKIIFIETYMTGAGIDMVLNKNKHKNINKY